jgi:ribokinase
MRSIVVVGSINIDLVVRADALPRAGETVLGRAFQVLCGGKGANQAVAAARLGGRVRMVGCVGSDEYGRMAKANLAKHHVGIRAVRTVAGSTGVALIVVDGAGRNIIAVAPNANTQVRMPRRPLDIVVTQLETAYALPRAGCFILNPAPARPESLHGRGRRPLAGVDFVIPNEHEAEALTGYRDPARAARALVRLGARHAIITLGERGVFDGTAGRRLPAFKVRMMDTVGAGDAFVGAFAVAIAGGHPDPVRFAHAAAALKCTRRGAQSGPSRVEVLRLVEGK